jgi:RNA polymerase primary sigma factor
MVDLTKCESQVVALRFGLLDGTPITLEEVGKNFSVTRERIRQIEAIALAKLRSPKLASKMNGLIDESIN